MINLFADPRLNHHTALLGGVMAEPASALLRQFFAQRRAQQRAERDALRGLLGEPPQEPPQGTPQDAPQDSENDAPIPAGETTEWHHPLPPPETR